MGSPLSAKGLQVSDTIPSWGARKCLTPPQGLEQELGTGRDKLGTEITCSRGSEQEPKAEFPVMWTVWAEALGFSWEWLLLQIFNNLLTSRFHFCTRFFYPLSGSNKNRGVDLWPPQGKGLAPELCFAAWDFLQVQGKPSKINTNFNSWIKQTSTSVFQKLFWVFQWFTHKLSWHLW